MLLRSIRHTARFGVIVATLALTRVACGSFDRSASQPTTQNLSRPTRDYADYDLLQLLLPHTVMPDGLQLLDQTLTSNEYVASLFAAPALAAAAMTESGRVNGAVAQYERETPAGPADPAVAVSSSLSWYRSVDGAQAVMRDPTMELVIHQFGLRTSELPKQRIAEESRIFRGFRDRDGPNLAAYLVLFRRQNLIGAVLVVLPSTIDDGGQLALSLARRQAARRPTTAAVSR